jgi:hypothetical protein
MIAYMLILFLLLHFKAPALMFILWFVGISIYMLNEWWCMK